MKKNQSKFVCSDCGSVSPTWLGKCPYCNKFGTLVEEFEDLSLSVNSTVIPSQKPKGLEEIDMPEVKCFMDEFLGSYSLTLDEMN